MSDNRTVELNQEDWLKICRDVDRLFRAIHKLVSDRKSTWPPTNPYFGMFPEYFDHVASVFERTVKDIDELNDWGDCIECGNRRINYANLFNSRSVEYIKSLERRIEELEKKEGFEE